ncbi:reverse transcriptase family protein [Tenacibaculum ovolyticum]|uniref:reverse transcriptase family protein n=1 Tax=Tenacibaculum ovolyticum TaxID=104270 RepID=UPI0007ECE770|nr:reverse transcriptase family protein [Tenacibaculum ovolyticum]
MKIEKKHINYIRNAFEKMQSSNDFLKLLNYTKPLVYGENYVPFELKQIVFYSNPKNTSKAYTEFQIKKKSGGIRTINAPDNHLKIIQKVLAFILQCIFQPHEAAKGFVKGKSIIDNAREHTGKNYVYNIDFKDFFSSIDKARIKGSLKNEPFNLNNKQALANIISEICCTEMDVEHKNEKGNWIRIKSNVLPQGAPTSPIFSNIICKEVDVKLTGVAKRFNLKYTRYADDITFSSMHNIYQENGDFLKELNRVIKVESFHIKESKTRLKKTGYRQEVTGLVVNDSVNVRKRYVKQIRMWLYYWEKYGYNKAKTIFLRDYIKDKGLLKSMKPNFKNVLSGKLEYLKMVKGASNSTYISLNLRFEKLSNKNNHIDRVLEEWERNGINKAILEYYRKPQQLFIQ